MKNCLTFLFLLGFLWLGIATGYAQNTKVGYVNSQLLYRQLPEVALADRELDESAKRINAELEKKKKDLDRKYQDQHKSRTMEEQATITEATASAQRAVLVRESDAYHEQMRQKQEEMHQAREKHYQQIEGKIQKAIQEVATEKGYDCILDVSTVVYHAKTDDITPLVLVKLSVK